MFHACHGALGDWCCTNHTHLIDYYKAFIQKNPKHLPGYMWLIDNLIADGRLDEAQSAADATKRIEETYNYPSYCAMIEERRGNRAKADECWQQMLLRYGSNASAWFVYGDHLVKHTRYQESMEAFEISMELSKPPRMTDALDSIAQICLLLKDPQGAIAAYERILKIMKEEWQITEGETVEGYRQSILHLKTK